MSATKIVLYIYIVIHIAFSVPDVFNSVSAAIISETKGNCTCAGFASVTPEAGSSPLLKQAPGLVVTCDDNGETTCKSLCVALATATKAKGPEILCNKLVNADELTLSAFYKVCDRAYLYANMTAEEPLCCTESKVKICASVNATSTVPSVILST